MSVASIGTISSSSGTLTRTGSVLNRFLNLPTASAAISSAACGTLSICTAPSLNRVMDSMFSTSRTSHCASSRTWPIKSFFTSSLNWS